MYNQTEKVNIRPKSYLPVFRVSEGDVGRTLTAHLVSDEGDISIPAGATVTMAGTKPSGLGYTVTGTVDGTDVSFETDAVMTDEPGRVVSEIRIVQDGTVIGTTNVVLSVEPNPHPDDTTDGRREPLVNEITALLEQITEQADRVEEYSGKVLDMTVTAHESDEVTVTKTEGEVVNLDFGLPRGPQGPQGIPGEDGQDGVTPDFTIGTVETLAPGEQATATITGTEEDPVLNLGIPQGAKGDKGDPGEVTQADFDKLLITDTASGEIASFPDGAAFPMRSLKITLEPIQSGSGTPSPDNVRPISGWDEVQTHKTGKNLFNKDNYNVLNGYIDSGVIVSSGSSRSVVWMECKPNTTYIISRKAVATNERFGFGWAKEQPQHGSTVYDSTMLAISTTIGATITRTLTTGADAKYLAIWLGWNDRDAEAETFQIEFGSTATAAYEPYDGQTITTTLPTTVYGGTLDVVSGVLTVDRIKKIFTTTDGLGSGCGYLEFDEPILKDNSHPLICNYLAYSPNVFTSISDGEITNRGGLAVYAFAKIAGINDRASFETYITNNPIEVVAYLATPQTYQLTPQEVQTLLGRNNVWSDGTVSIEYVADPKRYIQKMIGA